MQINKLSLHNFKQYKDEEISFVEGLTGFIGKNGAGKSTIFDAIHLAFYGKFGSNKELCKNDLASDKDNFSVSLEFEDKGKLYQLMRDFRGKALTAKAELSENNNLLATGVSEVNKLINRILRMDSKNFENSFFSKQKDVTSLLTLPVNDRQYQLRKMLGLSKLDKLEDKVKGIISDVKAGLKGKQDELLSPEKVEQIGEEISELTEEEKSIKRSLKKVEENYIKINKEYSGIKLELKELDKIKDENDRLVKKNDINENSLKSVRTQIQKTESEIESLLQKKKYLDKISEKKARYSKVNEEVDFLLEQKSLLEKKKGIEKLIKDLGRQKSVRSTELKTKLSAIKEFDGIDQKITAANELLVSAEETLDCIVELKEEISSSAHNISELIKEKKKRVKSIKDIGKTSPCPECERPLQEQYDKLLLKYKNEIEKNNSELENKSKDKDKVDKQIKEKKKNLSNIREQLSSLEKSLTEKESLTERISELKGEIKELDINLGEEKKDLSSLDKVEFDAVKLKSKQKERAELKKVYDEILELETMVKNIPVLQEELENNKIQEEKLLAETKILQKKIADLEFNRANYDKAKVQREEKEDELNLVKERVSEIKNNALQVASNKKLKQSDLDKNEKLKLKIDYIESEKITYEKLLAFVKEFKVKITSHELPAISAEASRLFSNITKGRYLNLRIGEDFNFTVTRDEKDVELGTLSGGEKDLASLCLRIAISKRISALAGRKNMGFLALDEVFGSQDEDRREELLNSLSEISKDFRQIFVISHNQDVQEAFSNRLMIKKSGNYSAISFSTN